MLKTTTRWIVLLLLAALPLSLAACVLRAPNASGPTIAPPPSPSAAVIGEPAASLEPSPTLPSQAPAADQGAQPTAGADPADTAGQLSPTLPQPTAYPPPASPTTAVQPLQPTATQPPDASLSTLSTFDPQSAYGDPTYHNPMLEPNLPEWVQAEDQALPDTQNLRLQFLNGQLAVSGKRSDFSTWWFSYHYLSDAYIEMTFDPLSCSGGEAYGFIFRGPPHLAGESYGYVVAFTCRGELWAYRLDSADPWQVRTLINPADSPAIHSGANSINVLGVRAQGDRFTIVANGYEIDSFQDDEYRRGRVGVFVQPAGTLPFTYLLTDFKYWDLSATG